MHAIIDVLSNDGITFRTESNKHDNGIHWRIEVGLTSQLVGRETLEKILETHNGYLQLQDGRIVMTGIDPLPKS